MVRANSEGIQDKFCTYVTAILGAQLALCKTQYKLHDLEHESLTVAIYIMSQKILCQLHVAIDCARVDAPYGHLVHLFVPGLAKEARELVHQQAPAKWYSRPD